MISDLRDAFNANFRAEDYGVLRRNLEDKAGTPIEFRVAETPIFLPKKSLGEMAEAGAELLQRLLAWPEYLAAARRAIPPGYEVAGDSAHPHFLTADFALIEDRKGNLAPRLVEIQAFPSVYAYQMLLSEEYRRVFDLPESLGMFLGDVTADGFWEIFGRTVLGGHAPENVVLTEVDPLCQKTLPDFLLTSKRFGIPVVDIASLVAVGKKLHYRNETGKLVPIHRIYNRAIADEMIARKVRLGFDLTAAWDVEWAGHPNWYFLVSKYALPWLTMGNREAGSVTGSAGDSSSVVPPAAFLDDFLAGPGRERLRDAGVPLPEDPSSNTTYEELLLKPLFSFAGKGIQFAPSRSDLEAIPPDDRKNYLVQQRMSFVPTIRTPEGMTQAEIRILYMWPDEGVLTPVLPLVRLGRGKMMGVDHNRDLKWVGASAAFWR